MGDWRLRRSSSASAWSVSSDSSWRLRLGVLGASSDSAKRTLFLFLDAGVAGTATGAGAGATGWASGSRRSFLDVDSSPSAFLFREGRTISMLELRVEKGAAVGGI